MANLFEIPNYIKAASPQGLRRLMFKAQGEDSMQYNFFNIQFVSGYWYAWYIRRAKTDTEKTEVVKSLAGD